MKSKIPDPSHRRSVRINRDRLSHRSSRSPVIKAFQLLAIATTGGAIMLVSLAGLAFLRSGSRFIEGVKVAFTPQPPEQTVDIRTVVIERVREVSELTTAVFTMEAVVPTQSSRKLGEFTIGETNLLYVAYGEVRAGVDLEELTTADVTPLETGQSIKLVLPPPMILGTELDVDRSNVYDYSRGLLNLGPDTAPELQELAQREAKAKIEQAACEQDILGQASSRAELVVTQLLQSAGFEEVVVERSPAANTACKSLS